MPSALTNIITAKEAGQTFQPLLLVEVTFNDGSVLCNAPQSLPSSFSR